MNTATIGIRKKTCPTNSITLRVVFDRVEFTMSMRMCSFACSVHDAHRRNTAPNSTHCSSSQVFDEATLKSLPGRLAIGHTRYSTTGASRACNSQPLVVFYKGGALALGHNGNLVNANILRDELQDEGYLFQTTIDTEVLAAYIARNIKDGEIEDAIEKTMK